MLLKLIIGLANQNMSSQSTFMSCNMLEDLRSLFALSTLDVSQVGGVQAGNGLGEGNFQAIFLEMLRQQSQAHQQNQQLIAALMRRMDLEEKRRNEAEEKAAETARLVAEAAARAKTEDPFAAAPSTPSVSFAGATSSSSSVRAHWCRIERRSTFHLCRC